MLLINRPVCNGGLLIIGTLHIILGMVTCMCLYTLVCFKHICFYLDEMHYTVDLCSCIQTGRCLAIERQIVRCSENSFFICFILKKIF